QKTFNAYLAISPSMNYDDGFIFEKADSMLSRQGSFNQYYYCSSGDIGRREAEFGAQVNKMDSLIKVHSNAGITWKKQLFENTGHWSCVLPSLSDALLSMSRIYWFDQNAIETHVHTSSENVVKAMEKFNKATKAKYDFVYKTPSNYLRFVASDLLDMDKVDVAEQLFQQVLKENPDELKAYWGMFDIAKKRKDNAAAVDILKEALVVVERTKDDRSEQAQKDIKEWVMKELKERE
ncbi:MAG: hypothetical protein AAGK97_01165, partial [Bacteroidota bacterium]